MTTDNDLSNKAQNTGDDIVFTNESNIKLNHEIEIYASSSGYLVTWVNIPSLSSSSNTKIYMYYGNPTSSNQENSSDTYSGNGMRHYWSTVLCSAVLFY